jgi:hypothetical protein
MQSTSNPKLVASSLAIIGALALAVVLVILKKGERAYSGAETLGSSDAVASAGVNPRARSGRTLALPTPGTPGTDTGEIAVTDAPLDEEEAPPVDVLPPPTPDAFSNPGAARPPSAETGLVFTTPPAAADGTKKPNTAAAPAQTAPAAAPQPQAPADVLPPTSPDAFQNPGERPARNRDSGLVFGPPQKTAEGLK